MQEDRVRDRFRVYYQNVRGLNTKTVECLSAVSAQEHDLIALTETWLDDSMSDAELFDDRYLVFRRDRGSRGGGVLLAVRSDRVRAARQLDHLQTVGEHIWVSLEFHGVQYLICVLYFPPSQGRDVSGAFFNILSENSDYLMGKNIIVIGDFNIPSSPYLRPEIDFICSLFNFTDINCVNNTMSNTRLDMILTNLTSDCGDVTRSDYVLVNEDNYHPALVFDVEFKVPKSRPLMNDDECENKMNGWKFGGVNFGHLNGLLSCEDWTRLYGSKSVDLAVDVFYKIVYCVFDKCFRKRSSVATERVYPKWYSRDVIAILRRKHLFHKIWKRSNKSSVYDEFRALRSRAKFLIRDCHRKYVEDCGNLIISNPRSFWNFINSKRSGSSLLSVMKRGSDIFEGHGEIASGFAQYFQTIYDSTASTSTSCLEKEQCLWSSPLAINSLSLQDLNYGFSKLKPIPSSGPDFIPDYILKGCKSGLKYPLLFIYNLILKSSVYPELWKCTKVTPIHKKGEASCIENYRPVTLLSAPAKIFEIILHKYVLNHCKPCIIDQQHGFRPARSTVTNLLTFSNFVSKSLDFGISVDVIYTDFEKAFDKVDHSLLVRKLAKFGLADNLTRLFANYLTGRCQLVKYGESYSRKYYTSSGVPQGSNLGPLLFVLFINDIQTVIAHSECLLYADDLKIYKRICSVSDAHLLQEDLDSIWKWASDNLLPLSVSKCHAVSFSRSLRPVEFSYHLGGNILARPSSTKDLGVTFEKKWRFDMHITEVHNKSLKMLGFVMRSGRYFDNILVLRTLYDTLVRSILEFSSIIWFPNDVRHRDMLEKVQRRFLRYLYLKEFGYYPFLFPSDFVLGSTGYNSLSSRRNVYVAKHFWKLLRGVVDNPTMLAQLSLWAPEGGHALRSRPLLMPVKARTGALANSPLAIAVKLLNTVHQDVDLFSATYEEFVRFLWNNTHLLG